MAIEESFPCLAFLLPKQQKLYGKYKKFICLTNGKL